MDLFKNNTVINWHDHVWPDENNKLDEKRLYLMMKSFHDTYMDLIVCSNPVLRGNPTPEEFIHCNNLQYEAITKYPKEMKGMVFVNPGYMKESLNEIDRCVNELGFIGVKLYNQYHISSPVVRDIIEKCIRMDIPILEHAAKLNHGAALQPYTSNGLHFAKVAEQYPEGVFIHAHIGGGGDWQWTLKAIEDFSNIFIDISGSVCDEDIIEQSVSHLGAKRILFGTDMSFSASIGKMLGADIKETEKIEILNNKAFEKYIMRG
ncbi:MAG: amidohydrolase family protein [Clostridia bacterium]|nr:amidohydrolase family protein [Clostridia bacterium]